MFADIEARELGEQIIVCRHHGLWTLLGGNNNTFCEQASNENMFCKQQQYVHSTQGVEHHMFLKARQILRPQYTDCMNIA